MVKNLSRNENCCIESDHRISYYQSKGYRVPSRRLILNDKQIRGIRDSGRVNTQVLDYIGERIHVGMSTLEIDQIVHEETIRLGGIPATLGYNGYPRSLCTSLNSQVCHGIPSAKQIIKDGDLINIDVSTNLGGYFSDSARVFQVGIKSASRQELIKISKACLEVGLSSVVPWTSMRTIGRSIYEYAKERGYSIATSIGGHGIGMKFHEEPFVSYDRQGTDMLLVPGMVFTIEPAVNAGGGEVYEDRQNNWTIYTSDGKDSAQWEVTVLVTEKGYEILAY
ncbi:MAG: type I methionyl aminopeptidase [Tissierellales bacterium]|nr:type I methionyl aminopeptidase [Tissierellales bacterium]